METLAIQSSAIIFNRNSPAEELPSVSYTGKVSTSKMNTTRTKRMMHNVLFLANIYLYGTEFTYMKTKFELQYSKYPFLAEYFSIM